MGTPCIPLRMYNQKCCYKKAVQNKNYSCIVEILFWRFSRKSFPKIGRRSSWNCSHRSNIHVLLPTWLYFKSSVRFVTLRGANETGVVIQNRPKLGESRWRYTWCCCTHPQLQPAVVDEVSCVLIHLLSVHA